MRQMVARSLQNRRKIVSKTKPQFCPLNLPKIRFKTPHDPFWTVIRGRWDRGGTFQYSEVGHPSAASATGKFTDAGMKEAKVKGGSKVDSYTATITFARDLTAADRKAAQDAENHHKAVYNGRKECVIS